MDKITLTRLANLRVAKSPQLQSLISGLSFLHDSGVLDILRERGKVRAITHTSPNYVEATAGLARYSEGYNAALDDLINFQEMYLETEANKAYVPLMDFGGLARAVKHGTITEEEADGIRKSGKR